MRALVSVGDTAGLVDFAQGLVDLGVELVAAGGWRGPPSPTPRRTTQPS
jgi:AICAR transformylase/IMP cyclohydrolase PurH